MACIRGKLLPQANLHGRLNKIKINVYANILGSRSEMYKLDADKTFNPVIQLYLKVITRYLFLSLYAVVNARRKAVKQNGTIYIAMCK